MLTTQSKAISFPVQILFLYQEQVNHSTKLFLICGHQNLLHSHPSILLLKNLVGLARMPIKAWESVFIHRSTARLSAYRLSLEELLKKIITLDIIQMASKPPGGCACHTNKRCK